jgi:hypothetical protein
MNLDDKDKFFDVMSGIPSRFITQALNLYGDRSNWTGCSKKLIWEFLFNGKMNLDKMPSLFELKDHAIRLQESSKKYKTVLKEMKETKEKYRDEEAKLKVSMKKIQKETVLQLINSGYKIDGIEVRLINDNNVAVHVSDIYDTQTK